MLLLIPLALITVLVVRALRPLFVVRFGVLPTHSIASLSVEMELYLCERDAGINSRRAIDIFYCQGLVVNRYLKKMWGRVLHVSQFAHSLDRINKRLPASGPHQVPWRRRGSLDTHGLLARTEPHLTFTDEEERLGQKSLRQLGVSDGAPFVCFHARDQAYVAAVMPEMDQSGHYHDCNFQNFLPAAEELGRRGNFALRMGAIVEEAMPPTDRMTIDYATVGRTDFMDVYLTANCRFYLGCSSGILFVPMIFRRPVVLTNYVPLLYIPAWNPDDLFTPKKLWLREERRFLTFHEMLDLGSTSKYRQMGIEVIENTPEEITAVAMEMDERLEGTWQTTEEDEELQRRFWTLFEPNDWNSFFACRIGAEFLRENKELLE